MEASSAGGGGDRAFTPAASTRSPTVGLFASMRLSNSFPTLSASPRSPLGVPVAGARVPPVALVPWTAHAGLGGRPGRSPPAPAPQTRFPPPRCDSSSCALSAVHPHDSAPSRSPTLPPFPSPLKPPPHPSLLGSLCFGNHSPCAPLLPITGLRAKRTLRLASLLSSTSFRGASTSQH